ncbi:MAG: amidase [Rhodoferax sp.]|nr:amidase [Rhodoferax sp.]
MLEDLLSTRHRLAAGATRAVDELERNFDCARTSACTHVFLKTSFDLARAAAADPANLERPLMGLAVSIKDLFDVAGEVTTAGSLLLQNSAPAQRDSVAVARLRRAGAAIMGRTNMTEFAYSGVGVNPHYGTPANAVSTDVPRIPGGSSSGAAVSVATGAAWIGLGSDTGGSIRIPAALNGVVGFKSTARLVPSMGAIPLSTTLDTIGAITRSVGDAILAHQILANRLVTLSPAPLACYRLAIVKNVMHDNLDPTVAQTYQRCIDALRHAGATIDEIELEGLQELGAMQATGGFSAAESYTWHRHLIERHSAAYDPRVLTRILRGATMSACDYLELVNARRAWVTRMEQSVQGYDAVLAPTVPIVAPPLADVAPGPAWDADFFRINALLLRNTSVVNMLDGCAVSLPCQRDGEPAVGLMVWHAAMHDDGVLNVARQIEQILQKQ